jgi:type VI secretion system protein ImpE
VSAAELLQQGDLDGALSALQDEVRKEPAKAKHRVFLFQLLTVLGQWDRALTQLNVVGDLDGEAMLMVQAYGTTLQTEALRRDVWAGKTTPLVFGDPEEWIALMLEAVRLDAAGSHAEATGLRARALEAAPATAGTMNGEPFEWIADGDDRLGPLLEAIVEGKLYWIPFHRIQALGIAEPADLRDKVWAPAHFTWANGGEAVGFVPTRYPGSEDRDDDAIRLAKKTDWVEATPDCWHGLGQRMLNTDAGEYAILDVRELVLETSSPPPPEGGDA